MAESYYSFEKGKYGGPCGSIYPFFTAIDGLSPLGEDYITIVPAGYLKCRGQILQADQYPNLAKVIGVGNNCLYRKEGTLLQDANDDGTGGTFQLPDFGSKYVSSGNTPTYNDLEVLNTITNTNVAKAGIGVTLSSGGNSVDFTYDGNFTVPARNLNFSGSFRASGPSTTPRQSVTIGQMLGHGHYMTLTICRRINIRPDGTSQGTWVRLYYTCGRSGVACSANGNVGVQYVAIEIEEEGSDAGTSHNHSSVFPSLNQAPPTGSLPQTSISASSITTTVNVNTRNTFKMDDIAPKFILCEYMIKF